MRYQKIDDYKIALLNDIPNDYQRGRLTQVFDFLNLITFYYMAGSDGRGGMTEPVRMSDMECLDGIEMAYNKLKELDGNPPEINFPKPKGPTSAVSPITLTPKTTSPLKRRTP